MFSEIEIFSRGVYKIQGHSKKVHVLKTNHGVKSIYFHDIFKG
jgi:hypothetical protein